MVAGGARIAFTAPVREIRAGRGSTEHTIPGRCPCAPVICRGGIAPGAEVEGPADAEHFCPSIPSGPDSSDESTRHSQCPRAQGLSAGVDFLMRGARIQA